MNCIGTGMRFWPTDENVLRHGTYANNLDLLKNNSIDKIKELNAREKIWREQVSSCPLLYDFLNKQYS